jgi:hypothetical protein
MVPKQTLAPTLLALTTRGAVSQEFKDRMSKSHGDLPPVDGGDSGSDKKPSPPSIGLEELAREIEAFGPIYIDTPPLPPKPCTS